ncbi:MAG: outer membrane beta-barrel protein [Bacteroidales bacterium]|nr:outer membrane beta-barrel protein [Bacteroidales bacterium]
MKAIKIFALISFLHLSYYATAQRYTFWPVIGLNLTKIDRLPVSTDNYTEGNKPGIGFQSGLQICYRVSSHFNFLTGFFFLQRSGSVKTGALITPFDIQVDIANQDYEEVEIKTRFRFCYLQTPFGIKVNTDHFNVFAGINSSYCIKAKEIQTIKDFPSNGDKMKSVRSIPISDKNSYNVNRSSGVPSTDWGFFIGLEKSINKFSFGVNFARSFDTDVLNTKSLNLYFSYNLFNLD